MSTERCTSTWQQMPSQPVIRCARRADHPVRDPHQPVHWNSRAQRQWTEAQAISQPVDTLLVLTTQAPGDHTLWAMRNIDGIEFATLVATVHPGARRTIFGSVNWGATNGAPTLDGTAIRLMALDGTDVRRVPTKVDATPRDLAAIASFLGMGLWA